MSVLAEYNEKLLHSPVLNPGGDYGGVSNPAIYERFAAFMAGKHLYYVWDSFANKFGDCIPFFFSRGVNVISFNIDPVHPDVLRRDSTKEGPIVMVDAVIIHPPYFGSAPQSDTKGELSLCQGEIEYFFGLVNTVGLAVASLAEKGYVCAVGRHYRTKGKAIKLDEWFVNTLDHLDFKLVEVWRSTPDVAIVMQR